jgi:hypothetical protein
MSNETSINSLSGGISEEDSKLVDSILNDLGQGSQGGPPGAPQAPQGGAQGGMDPQQMQQMQQQQLAQQQLAQQQLAQQQQMQQMQQMQQGPHMVSSQGGKAIMDEIKHEAKSIVIIIFLSILMNLDQVNSLFQKITLFVSEGGSLNMQCVFTKALLIGSLFFVIKTKLL